MNAVEHAALPAIWFHVLKVVHVFGCSAVIPIESGTVQAFVQHLLPTFFIFRSSTVTLKICLFEFVHFSLFYRDVSQMLGFFQPVAQYI